MTDKTKPALYALTPDEHATVIAALRYYQKQGMGDPFNRSDDIHEIATNGGDVFSSLDDEGIDKLCESINHEGLEFGEIVNLLGDDDSDPYVAAAHEHRLLDEGTLEVDAVTIVSRGDDNGAYVMAWLWVDGQDEGGEDDEPRFLNHYRHCGQEWSDEWSCMCNDRCPVCNREIEPYESEDLTAKEEEQ